MTLIGCPETSVNHTNVNCITSQMSEGLMKEASYIVLIHLMSKSWSTE